MGNCLPKIKKKNRVSPAPEDDISEIIGKSAETSNPNDPADMVKAMEEDEALDSQLPPEVARKLAVAFTVDLDDDAPVNVSPQMPKRLAERLAAEKESKSEFDYTDEEETLMAEIMRQARLKEVKEKAVREEIKIYDAQRKRFVLEKSREAQLDERVRCSTPVAVSDARQRVKELAEADRKKAAGRRKDSLQQ